MAQKTGLFIGRFQPFHLGHIDALNQARKFWITEFFIGIWSSNKEHTSENPFSYEERKNMITKILNAMGVKFTIYPIPDVEKDENRKEYIMSNIPKFDCVISGDIWTTNIFKKTKYPICNIKIMKDIQNSSIKHMLHVGDIEGLKELVPGQAIIYLKSMKADKRLEQYYLNENIGPKVGVEWILLTKDKRVVIIQKKDTPVGYALPGWFIKYGETIEQAFTRIMKEKVGVHVRIKKLAGVISDPKRDPNNHAISICYIADIISGRIQTGENVKAIKIMKLEKAQELKMVAGHDIFLQNITL